jgi:putative ABC transport system permease protein
VTWRWPWTRRRRPSDPELDAELADHLDRQAADYVRQGLSVQDARRRTLIEFGGPAQIRDACRDARIARWRDELRLDVRYGVRALLKERWFTAVAVAALALGIGVYNVQFAILNAICIRGLPIERADRVIYVSSRDTQNRDGGVSARDFEDLRAASRAFAGLAGFSVGPVAVGDEGRAPDRVIGAYVSLETLTLIGAQPSFGRGFRAEDDRPGAPPVTLLAGGLWKSRYAADPAIIGRAIRINGVPSTVVGVMPDGFKFPNGADLWQPLALMPGFATEARDVRALGVFGRLRDGIGLAQAQAEFDVVAAALARAHPDTNHDVRAWLVPINERYNGKLSEPVWQAFIVAGILVALIASANVANLLLARSARRAREIAIRASLGATRLRIVRQLMVESLLLAVAGGLAGGAVSAVGLRVFARVTSESILPYWVTLTMDARGFAGLALMSAATVLVFGLAPALQASRTGVQGTLKDGGAHDGPRTRRLTTGFLTIELALTMVLLNGIVGGYLNTLAVQRADLVIDPRPLLSMWVTLPAERYPSASARAEFFDRLGERLRDDRNIAAWTWTSALPFAGGVARPVAVDGRPLDPAATTPTVSIVAASRQYFETLGLHLEQGHGFSEADDRAGRMHAVVNRRFVRLHFPNADPIGRHIAVGEGGPNAPTTDFTIVGVSPDVRQRSPLEPEPVAYLPARLSAPATAAIVVRSIAAPETVAARLREEVRALDPDLPLYRVLTMEQALWEAGLIGRVSNGLASTITVVAFILALVGLYAVTAQGVLQRTHEIGIRMALGASSGKTVWLVLRQALVRLATGIIAGYCCTLLWGRLLGDPTAPNRVTDPATFGLIALVVLAVAMLACLVPAREATRIDPVIALRLD